MDPALLRNIELLTNDDGQSDAQLALAARRLIDRNGGIQIDPDDHAATAGRMGVARYLGTFIAPPYLEASGVHLTAKPGDFAFLTLAPGGMVHFTGVPGQYYVHIGVNFDRWEPAAPNQPVWLSSYVIRGVRMNFVNHPGSYLSGFYADALNVGFIDVSASGSEYVLDVLIVPDPAVPNNFTEFMYSTPVGTTVDGNVDEYTFDVALGGGDYLEGNRVGDPTGEIPLHFKPALGFYD